MIAIKRETLCFFSRLNLLKRKKKKSAVIKKKKGGRGGEEKNSKDFVFFSADFMIYLSSFLKHL